MSAKLLFVLFSLTLSSRAAAGELIPVYRVSSLDIGPADSPVSAYYIVIEGVDPDEYVLHHYPSKSSSERMRLSKELRQRAETARNVLDILGGQFKKSIAGHNGQISKGYAADIDARISLAKLGRARFAAIASVNPLFDEIQVYAMAGIFPDFGQGPPLQIIDGKAVALSNNAPTLVARKESVRIFGSGEAFYFDENTALSAVAGNTVQVWGDRVAVAFFAVPRTSIPVAGFFWPNAKNNHALIDWKVYLLNLVIADGLLLYGERRLESPLPLADLAATELKSRISLFHSVAREPHIRAETLGLATQVKVGISEIQLFTYSKALAELFFPTLGFVRSDPGPNLKSIGDLEPIVMKTSRTTLESVGLEKLRNTLATTDPFFRTAKVSRASGADGAFGDRFIFENFLRRCAEALKN